MARKWKPTKAQTRVIEKMQGGVMLRHQHDDPQFFLDGDQAVSAATVRSLERHNIISKVEDGLFAGDSQTYVLTGAA